MSVKDLQARAYSLGQAAFRDGKMAVPAHDPKLTELMRQAKSLPQTNTVVGNMMKAWTRGWTEANLAEPVPGVVDTPSVVTGASGFEKNFRRALQAAKDGPGDLKRIKRITSHVGWGRYLTDELENEGEPIGQIDRITYVPSPYAYSPTWRVYRTIKGGKNVIVVETAHKRYDVFELPPGMTIKPVSED